MYTFQNLKHHIRQRAEAVLGVADLHISQPPPGMQADFSVPLTPLLKRTGRSMQELGDLLVQDLQAQGHQAWHEKGFLNLKLNRVQVTAQVIQDLSAPGPAYAELAARAAGRVVMDVSSPNVAKPMSVGHLRSTIIGDALCHMLQATGHQVTSINYYADWGTQFGTLLYGFTHWLDPQAYQDNPIRELLRVYIQFEEEATRNPDLRDAARAWSVRLEAGDPEAQQIWQSIVDHSLEEFRKIYSLLQVDFDVYTGESLMAKPAQQIIEDLLARGIAEVSEGAVIVQLEDQGIPTPFVLRRSDGATLYSARDVASAVWRIETFQPDRMIYVVGVDQKLHFRQLFATLRKMGHQNIDFQHVDFGLVSLPEGKMSTRKGRVVFLEDVLQEAIQRSREMAAASNPSTAQQLSAQDHQTIGVGAVKYSDLSQNRIKNITFTWEKMLSFDGNSAPYIMYAYARARRILEQAPSGTEHVVPPDPMGEEEWQLVRLLGRFPDALQEATQHLQPHILAQSLYELCQQFNAFYNRVPVLKSEAEVQPWRLWLVQAFVKVVFRAATLLHIQLVERM